VLRPIYIAIFLSLPFAYNFEWFFLRALKNEVIRDGQVEWAMCKLTSRMLNDYNN
jgi:hypothetical protein